MNLLQAFGRIHFKLFTAFLFFLVLFVSFSPALCLIRNVRVIKTTKQVHFYHCRSWLFCYLPNTVLASSHTLQDVAYSFKKCSAALRSNKR